MSKKSLTLAALCTATVFTSSFLLFLVQPIIAKQIVPWFGGSAAVWTICLVFFQVCLLAGYGYADWLSRRSMRLQLGIHATLLITALSLLPIIPSPDRKPTGLEDPTWAIVLVLATTIGLAYTLVSSTGPLLQSWFARAQEPGPAADRAYRLFSLSNLASLVALLAYPFLIEPSSSVRLQAQAWSAGFGLFTALALGTGYWVLRHGHARPGARADTGHPPPHKLAQLKWFGLSALGTVMLLTVTEHATQNVMSAPLVWILPLTLYLLSFVLCFDSAAWYWRKAYWIATPMVLLMMAWLLLPEAGIFQVHLVLLPYMVGLFVLCMFFNGELAHSRPSPQHLTRYYLLISLGGAAGGLSVGMGAPLVFNAHWDLILGIGASWLAWALVVWNAGGIPPSKPQWKAGTGIGLVVSCVCLVWCGIAYVRFMDIGTIARDRNFYGTLVVREGNSGTPEAFRLQAHGAITHGIQHLDPAVSMRPTSYFTASSGAGVAIKIAGEKPEARIAVIGLGVGTFAAYARPDRSVHFYEIDPNVMRQAREHFSYLSQARGPVEITLGDARLSLERSLKNDPAGRRFDVLVSDAFSGGAIPVHLLTQEALQLYRAHLAPGGLIAIHISNRHLDLAPVLAVTARRIGMQAVLVKDLTADRFTHPSDYVLIGDQQAIARVRADTSAAVIIEVGPGFKPWTDDHSNLLQAMKPYFSL